MLLKMSVETNRRDNMVLLVFMGIAIKRNKLTNIIQHLQVKRQILFCIMADDG